METFNFLTKNFDQLQINKIKVDPNSNYPNEALKKLIENNKFIKQNVETLDLNSERNPEKIRIVVVSDTHSQISSSNFKLPNADILIHAGDFTMHGSLKEIDEFNKFISSFNNIKYKIVIAGNHELDLNNKNRDLALSLLKDCIYLEDDSIKILGLNIYGSPYQPYHCGNAFQLERGEDLLKKWNKIPSDTDILITHGPPLGYGDIYQNFRHAGCVDLLNTIRNRVKPKYHIFGHIHQDYGVWQDGYTTFVNASICDRRYKPLRKPILFDVDIPIELLGDKENRTQNTG